MKRRAQDSRLLLPVFLAGLMALPACLDKAASAKAKPAAQEKVKSGEAAARKAAAAEEPAKVAEKKAPATGSGRNHPFARAIEMGSSGRGVAGKGKLHLKGIIGGHPRLAIIQAGSSTYFVPEGETISDMEVLRIGEDEVVLRVGQRKQVLFLYPPQS